MDVARRRLQVRGLLLRLAVTAGLAVLYCSCWVRRPLHRLLRPGRRGPTLRRRSTWCHQRLIWRRRARIGVLLWRLLILLLVLLLRGRLLLLVLLRLLLAPGRLPLRRQLLLPALLPLLYFLLLLLALHTLHLRMPLLRSLLLPVGRAWATAHQKPSRT